MDAQLRVVDVHLQVGVGVVEGAATYWEISMLFMEKCLSERLVSTLKVFALASWSPR